MLPGQTPHQPKWLLTGCCVSGMIAFNMVMTVYVYRYAQIDQPNQQGKDCGERPHTDLVGKISQSTSEYQVPNLVHYIWYNEKSVPLQWHQMLSIISVHKIINPDVLYFHTNCEPTGPYWDRVRSLPKLKIVQRNPTTRLYGEDLKVTEPKHDTDYSDVDRVVILMEYGGIYLDLDVVVVKPFDHLRKYACTIGLEMYNRTCGGIIVCSKEATFLKLWLNSYLDDYRIDQWAYNSGLVPFKLWKRFPELVHVEETRLHRPNWDEIDHIIGQKTWDWQDNYSVHLWYRKWKYSPYFKEPNDHNIKHWNCTFGQIARFVLFGSSNLIAKY